MNEISLFTLIIVLIATIISSAGFYILLKRFNNLRYREYDWDNQRALLEMMRSSNEKLIYEITDRMMVTENRWRDINHLLITSQKSASDRLRENKEVYLSNFLKSSGISEEDLKVERDLVLTLTPFHKDCTQTFDVIKSVCSEVNLRCFRGDEQYKEVDILDHILKLMVRSRLIIANIDGRNPNVFYELGIAHALEKGVILISDSIQDLPIDIKSKYIVIYNDHIDLHNQLRKEITRALVST